MDKTADPSHLDQTASVLFVPGDRPERFAKAAASGAGALILDLEDAVLPDAKAAARRAIGQYLSAPTSVPVLVRINAAGTSEHDDDVALCRSAKPAAIVLPKTESAAAIAAVHAETGCQVWPLVETARGLAALSEIAGAESADRLILGTIDLALDLDIRLGTPAGERVLDDARFAVIVASRAAGKAFPLDGVYTAIKDADGLAIAAIRARDGGFGGMLCIHPAQCPVVNTAFAPTAAQIAWATKVIAAVKDNPGAFQLDGQMIDAPVAARARRILQHSGS